MSKEAGALIEVMAPLLRFRPEFEDFCRFGGTWAAEHAAPAERGWAQFHIVSRGGCILERAGLGEMHLGAGDVLLLPHGDAHVVRSKARGVLRPIVSTYRNGVRHKSTDGVETDTELLCGRLFYEAASGNPLLAILPDEIVIRTAGEPLMDRFSRILTDMREELDGGLAGSATIASDFARVLFVLMLRDHLVAEPRDDATLSLLRHRTTARVVLAMLSDLARDWSLDDLASAGVTSRATLVRLFREHGATAPMEFLSDLRLGIARQRLAGSKEAVAKIAADIGYASEGALSKAIMRRFGLRPGALRRASGEAAGTR